MHDVYMEDFSTFHLTISYKECRDEDPVLAKKRIRVSVPQTKGDF